MPRNPNTPRLARWISRFHLGTPFRSTFSLSFTLSLSLFFQRNSFRGAHQNRLNFELALARLLLSRCHFISTRSTVENVLRTYTQYPPPLDIANYSAFISSLSLSFFFFLSSNSRVVERSSPGSRWRWERRRKKNFGRVYNSCKINRGAETGCQRDLSNKFPRADEYFVTAFKQCPGG